MAEPSRAREVAATVLLAAVLATGTAAATEAPPAAPAASPAKAAATVARPAKAAATETPPEQPPPSTGNAAAAVPAAGDLSSLLAGMRSASGVVAHFTETKELALLSAPLEAAGTIYFVPPGRLVRVVSSPGRSRLVVDGDKVRFEDETGSKAMDLSGSPIARQMIDSFVVLFNGDEARLKDLYETEFSTDGASPHATWRLHLVPRRIPLSRMIGSFDLTGSGARIDRMVAVEPDGDRTVTVFGETDAQHRFSDKELAELFGARPGS